MSAPATMSTRVHARVPAPAPRELPRLLAGMHGERALELDEHEALHGPLPRGAAGSRTREREALFAEVERAGLLGRGGAAFPTADKLRAVAGAGGRPIVVVNAVEAEPASAKDRVLLQKLPHLVLDGAILVAQALGAEQAIVAVNEHRPAAAAAVHAAIAERGAADGAHPPQLTVASIPSRYVAGQESALVHHLNGGPATPTFTPPRPFERGVHRRPTLVSNAETLAHLALIARHGAAWFRELGTPAQPGSTLLTLSGALARPGVYEIEPGARLGALLERAGAATHESAGALIGGYGGTWVAPRQLTALELSSEQLAHHGAAFGAGVVVALSARACPVREVARLARWLAGESARQCGPCMFGLPALAALLEAMAEGRAPRGARERLHELASLTERRGACAHPDLAVHMIASALYAFEPEFREHMRGGPCARCGNPAELSLPPRSPALTAPRRTWHAR